MQTLLHHDRIRRRLLRHDLRAHVAQRFRPALDRGQRRAQLMGNRADEFIFHRFRRGKLIRHVVDTRTELADLVLALLIDARRKIALREFFRIRVDFTNRAQDGTHKVQIGKPEQQQQRDCCGRDCQHKAGNRIVNGFQRGDHADRTVFLTDLGNGNAHSHDALTVFGAHGFGAVALSVVTLHIVPHGLVIIRHADCVIRRKAGGCQHNHAVVVDRHQLHFVLIREALQRAADLRIQIRTGIRSIARQHNIDAFDLCQHILLRRIVEIALHRIDDCQHNDQQDQNDHAEVIGDPAACDTFLRHSQYPFSGAFSGDSPPFPPICSRSPRS